MNPKLGWVVLVCSMQWYNVLQSSLLSAGLRLINGWLCSAAVP